MRIFPQKPDNTYWPLLYSLEKRMQGDWRGGGERGTGGGGEEGRGAGGGKGGRGGGGKGREEETAKGALQQELQVISRLEPKQDLTAALA